MYGYVEAEGGQLIGGEGADLVDDRGNGHRVDRGRDDDGDGGALLQFGVAGGLLGEDVARLGFGCLFERFLDLESSVGEPVAGPSFGVADDRWNDAGLVGRFGLVAANHFGQEDQTADGNDQQQGEGDNEEPGPAWQVVVGIITAGRGLVAGPR